MVLRVWPMILRELRPIRRDLLRAFPDERVLRSWRGKLWTTDLAALERELEALRDDDDPDRWSLVRMAGNLLAVRNSNSLSAVIRLVNDAASGLMHRASGKKTIQTQKTRLQKRDAILQKRASEILERKPSLSVNAIAKILFREQAKLA